MATGIDEDGTVLSLAVASGHAKSRPIVWFPNGSWKFLPLGAFPATSDIRNGWAIGA